MSVLCEVIGPSGGALVKVNDGDIIVTTETSITVVNAGDSPVTSSPQSSAENRGTEGAE